MPGPWPCYPQQQQQQQRAGLQEMQAAGVLHPAGRSNSRSCSLTARASLAGTQNRSVQRMHL
jgi:hypothetical protein